MELDVGRAVTEAHVLMFLRQRKDCGIVVRRK
jgi:hypothetical protein